eukprot:13127281-Alexandrium_andersonii.AAC.1
MHDLSACAPFPLARRSIRRRATVRVVTEVAGAPGNAQGLEATPETYPPRKRGERAGQGRTRPSLQ